MPFDLPAVVSLIRQQSEGLAARLDQLIEADWRRPSPCADWTIADIVAHLSSGAGVQLDALRRGLAGDSSPQFADPAERAALTATKRSLPDGRRAADYRAEMDTLLAFFAALTESQLDIPAWHQSGVHPLRWFPVQRLGETTMHRGDVHAALGDPFEYPNDVATLLLPAYVARLPGLVPLPSRGERLGEGASFPDALIHFPNAGFIRIEGGAASYLAETTELPTLSLEAPAATLLRIVVGRLEPVAAQPTGDTTPIARWRELFRPL